MLYTINMSRFTHLHTHSHYSLLSALPKIPELVDAANEAGMKSIALTDLGNLYGAVEFYKECHKKNIKPIIGLESYVAARTRKDKVTNIDNRRTRAILLAKNETGYKNLIRLVTAAHLEGFYYKPRIDWELIEKYHEGLVFISPIFGGNISLALKNRDTTSASETAGKLREIYGKDFYLELIHQESKEHEKLFETVYKLAKQQKIPVVASHNVYYIKPEDKKARDTLISIQNNPDYQEASLGEYDLSFQSAEETEKVFSKEPEAIDNNAALADSINIELKLGKWVFPDYKTTNGLSYDEELKRKVQNGLKQKNLEKNKGAKERIEYELKVIKDKGYAPYFLVVGDLLDYAHKNNILTTIRGSVAGSLVTYLAGITNVNPLEYNLPFERFLNPERPSAPDIDMDFADNRRDEMIDYARQKYGADKVAQIGTFGTMMARGSVRDTARALGYEYNAGDRIAKLIPFGSQGFPMSIDRAMEIVPELSTLYKKEKDVREIINMAKKIEGCARHISVHAAGVVISPQPLTEYVPLQYDPKGEGKIITQYDMHAVEDAGLLKFDFLGIKNLSILANAVTITEKLEGKKIDIENIPLDDKKTFAMLAKGETGGLFQLNGQGMTKYLKDLKPSAIDDINAMVALFRPGPMESIPKYIERKHNPRLVQYLDSRMKDILDKSYGVITYQDDVMLIAIKLAGYSWLEADKLRKAMGKKIPAEMAAQREKLITGLIKNGMTENKAGELWALIEPFAAYGFNKAHAASYGKVAYQTAYMKANFPAIYMSAVLTADSGDTEKIGEIINECKRMGIPVLPPNINESFEGFTVVKREGEPDRIRFGLVTIKNFGAGIAKSIIDERKEKGRFKNLADFLERINDRNLNKKSLEALIKSGALDDFGERGAMFANLDGLLDYHKEHSGGAGPQNSLFGGAAENIGGLRLAPATPANTQEKLLWEKELLGLYVSGHPLDRYKKLFEKRDLDIKRVREQYKEGMQVVVGGIIEEAKRISTKNNDTMMFIRLADFSGSIEVVIFPKIFAEAKDMLITDQCIAIKARVSNRNDQISLIAEKIKKLEPPA